MGIKDLIGKVGYGPGVPFADRISVATHGKIRSDFLEVAKAEKAGNAIPSVSAIVRFVNSEYDVKMDRGTADRWLKYAREVISGEDK